MSLIDKEQPHGKNFYTKAAKRPDLLTSGYMISSYLILSTNPQTGKELEERVLRVQDNQYFDSAGGMTRLEAEAAAAQLESHWSSQSPAALASPTISCACSCGSFPSHSS